VEIDGIALRRWREERMVSQGELARLARMNIASVNRLEVGNRTRAYRSTVRRLAAALGVAPLDLLKTESQRLDEPT
jgi:predicted transcriptional regulator